MANPIKTTVTKAQAGSPLLFGLLVTIIGLGAGALLLSLLLRFSSLQESQLPNLALCVHGLAALAGGFAAGRRTGRKGWRHGGLLGAVYALLIMLIGFLAADAPLSYETLILLAVTIPAGAVGGMFGVGTGR